MAKHCDVCNQDYPETEPHCPHCAAAGRTGKARGAPDYPPPVSDEADLAQTVPSPDSSAVDLGEPFLLARAGGQSEPVSGTSDTAWSALVEDADAEPSGHAPAKIDSPSDRDLLAHAAPSAPVADDSAVGGEPFVAEAASGVNLTAPPTPMTPAAGHENAAVGDSAVGGEPFVAELASGENLTGSPPSDVYLAGRSDSHMGSDVRLAGKSDPDVRSDVRLADKAGPRSESEVLLGDLPPAHGASDVRLAEGSDLGMAAASRPAEDESSAIDLAALAAQRPGDSDPVEAEVVEGSGVHLGSDPELILGTAGDKAVEGSGVHLGSDPDIRPGSDPSGPNFGSDPSGPDLAALAEPESEARPAEDDDTHFLDDVAEVEAASAVNLGEAARPTDRPSSRDRIAEAVESGVDLGSDRGADDEATEADEVIADEADSAVDLGAAAVEETPTSGPEAVRERHVPPGSEHDIDLGDEEAAAEHVDLTAPAEGESAVAETAERGPGSSGVDLGGKAGRPPKRSLAAASSDVDLAGAAADSATEAAARDEEDEAPARAKRKRAAAAEEDEEETAAGPEAAEEEDRPAPKGRKARAGVGYALVGSLLGLLVGAGGTFGVMKLTEGKPPAQNVGQGGPVARQPVPQGGGAPAVADAGQFLKNGDFAKAVEGLKAAPEQTPEVQAQRGTARWMQYLQDQMAKGAPLKADDDAVKEASADLAAAAEKDNPEALLALGNLQEYTAGPAAALKTYQDGLQKFAGKPGWARAFQAQIDRLESSTARPGEGGKPAPRAEAPRPGDNRETAARALVELLVAFQAGEAAAPAAGDGAEAEAGFEFWAAVKAAKNADYVNAVKALEAARAAHEKRRFTRLRKAQNPLSDPTEEIFLRCAKEIEAYWRLQYYLKDQGALAKGGDPQKAIQDLFKTNVQLQTQMKGIADKLKTAPEAAAAGVDKLVKERDDATAKARTLDTELTAAKKDAEAGKKEVIKYLTEKNAADEQLKTAEDKLKSIGARLEAAGVKNPDPAKGVEALAADRAAADKALTAVGDKLALANVKVDKKDVLHGVDRVVEMALAKDPKADLAATREEIRRLDGALAQRRTPQEMLDVWLPIVADRNQKDAARKAAVDAERVRNDAGAAPAAKKKAAAVLGLAQRNLGDITAARTSLADALAGPKADWQPAVAQALKELTDPAAYYLPRAKDLYENGKVKEANAVLSEGRKLFPKEEATFLAQDSLVQLDLAREKGKGKIDPTSAEVKTAKEDAEKAAAAGSAEGHYALGRINEELGNMAAAKASYAKALAAHRDNDEAGARYRLALARVLKTQSAAKPAGAAGAAATVPHVPVADLRRQPLMTLVLLVEVGLQAGVGPEQDEANRLLEEVQNVKDGPDTFMLKAQAQALRGLWTPALKTYVAGLRAHVRRDYADGLAELIDRHPALRRPPSMDPPNPLLAEASYAAGLRRYFARQYRDAEAEFLKAIEYDNQDARYFYFLGLSRLALNNAVDADADFHEGAQLESMNRPGREAVSSALERVQGPARQALNRARP